VWNGHNDTNTPNPNISRPKMFFCTVSGIGDPASTVRRLMRSKLSTPLFW